MEIKEKFFSIPTKEGEITFFPKANPMTGNVFMFYKVNNGSLQHFIINP